MHHEEVAAGHPGGIAGPDRETEAAVEVPLAEQGYRRLPGIPDIGQPAALAGRPGSGVAVRTTEAAPVEAVVE
jgi:hypothetical protein